MTVRVKICGITRVEDARLAVELGADYVGLNFYPPSPRFVDAEQARRIRDAVGDGAQVVGVLINREPAEVEELAAACGLDLLQFHGDETPEEVLPFASRAIKGLRFRAAPRAEDLSPWRECWGVLFDTPHESLYGGSGVSWPYERVAAAVGGWRAFVAGGVRPETVQDLVRAVPQLYAVDVCSGVEARPGVKDARRMHELFARLHQLSEVGHG